MPPTDVGQIIARVLAHGGELTPMDDGNIRYRGAPLTDELRTLLRAYKPQLLQAKAANVYNKIRWCIARLDVLKSINHDRRECDPMVVTLGCQPHNTLS